MTDKQGVAVAVSGWSVRHRVVAVIGWLAFVASPWRIGSAAGQQSMTEDEYATGDSAKAIRILDDAGLETPAGEMVLVTSSEPVTDAAGPAQPSADLCPACRRRPR